MAQPGSFPRARGSAPWRAAEPPRSHGRRLNLARGHLDHRCGTRQFHLASPANVLVVQNERDNATPLAGGVLLREAFGDRARLVTVDGDGHGVYVYGDNPCALNVTTQFLLDGELPAADVYCEASTASGLELDDADEERREDVLDRITQ
jgi:hypothetical protein